MPQLLDDIEWNEESLIEPYLTDSQKEKIKSEIGFVPANAYYMGYYDWMVDGFLDMYKYLEIHSVKHIPNDLVRLISMVEAQESTCRFCYGSYRARLKMLGYDEEDITKIEQDLMCENLPDKYNQVCKLVRRVCRLNPRPDLNSLLEGGNGQLSRIELGEILFITCLCNTMEFLSVGLAFQPEEKIEKMGQNKLGRWIGGLLMKWVKSKANPEISADNEIFQKTFPFSELTHSYSEDHYVPSLIISNLILKVWQTDDLSKSAKLAIWLITAKMAEADDLINEISEWFKQEGFGESEIQRALDHLEFDWLDPLEMKTLELARKSVRKKSDELQRWSFEFLQQATERQLLLALVAAGIGNFVSRINLLQ